MQLPLPTKPAVHMADRADAHLAAFGLAVSLVFLCLIVEVAGLDRVLPTPLLALMGAALFASAPGFLVLSYLSLLQQHRYSALTIFLLSTSLSFTCSFLLNIAVFALKTNIEQAYLGYLVVLVGCYGVLVVILWRRRPGLTAAIADALWAYRSRLAYGAAVVVALTAILLLRSHPGLFIEELFIVRKLADLPEIRVDNLSLLPNSDTTYIFLPFSLFLSLVACFADADVFTIILLMGPYLAVLSYAIVVKLTLLVTESRNAVVVASVLFAAFALVAPLLTSDRMSFLLPPADRYAVASAILLPLAMFHFLVHMRDEQINAAMLIGLIYLIVEISFVHARETVFFIGFAVCYLLVILVSGEDRAAVTRCATVIVIVCAILVGYRFIALTRAPELGNHVRDMAESMRQMLAVAWSQGKWASLLGFEALVGAAGPVTKPYNTRQFAEMPGFRFVPLMISLLPIYVLTADRGLRVLLAVAAAGLVLFALTPGLQLIVGAVVGSWHVFGVFSFLVLLLFIMFADLLARAPTLVSHFWDDPGVPRQVRWLFVALLLFGLTATFGGLALIVAHKANLGPLLRGLIEQLGGEAIPVVERLLDAIVSPYATRSRTTELLVALVTIGVAFAKLSPRSTWDRSLLGIGTAAGRTISGRLLLWTIVAAFVVCLPLTIESRPGDSPRLAGLPVIPEVPSYGGSWCPAGPTQDVLACINEARLLAVIGSLAGSGRVHLPESLVDFVRNEVPPGQVWLGTETIAVMIAGPHYAPVITSQQWLTGDFLVNDAFGEGAIRGMPYTLEGDLQARRFDLARFLESEQGRSRLIRAIVDHDVDWLIGGPRDVERVKALLARDSSLADLFPVAFDRDGYLVLSARSPQIQRAPTELELGQRR